MRKRHHICPVCRRPSVGKMCTDCYHKRSNRGRYRTEYDLTNTMHADLTEGYNMVLWIRHKNSVIVIDEVKI